MKDLTDCDRRLRRKVLKTGPKWMVEHPENQEKMPVHAMLKPAGSNFDARATYVQALGLRNDLVWAKLGLTPL